ncbi:MAG: chromosome segregation protein SMC [Oscillospiraceae bacterium]|nr:chromosome segregation protein SMC [Oscillospiraceae bacterium]
MILKSLELQGFKSFPDKTVLSFDKGMTAVVGPNGSGKSNISDAVRWVLGEQSTKNLRGSKMEDVVFGGTDIRKAMGYAEVTLRLDNKDRSLANDEDEVSITRRYYRSGESEYQINGKVVRLKDVNELFMDTGLGRDGYSIVSQGKVADMVSAKSKERRDMLEEAAGISHYRYRRTDALRRLSQTEENLVRLRDILAELEGRVGPLKIQSEKAEKFLVLANEKKELEISLWLYTIDSLKEKLRDQERKIELSSSQYHSAEEELESIENKIEEIIESTRNITLEIEEIRRGMSEHDERMAEISSSIAVNENTILHNNQSIERIQKDMDNSAGQRSEIEKTIEDANAQIEKLNSEVDEKREELSNLTLTVSSLSKENEENSGKTLELQNNLAEVSKQLADCRVRKSSALSGCEEIKSRSENVDSSLSERNKIAEQFKNEEKEVLKRLSDCEETIKSINNTISGYSLRVKTRSEKYEKQKADLEALRIDVSQKESKIRMLEDLEKNMEGYSGSVKSVMKESARGALSGIHGPLSKLITVKDKYAAAIETALGAAVQFVVVDKEADAKRAINFLKDTKGGRATFLPIAAIKGKDLQEKGLDDCFGFVNIASELVSADKKYDEIVKAQLARTVVVEDIDSAIAIGKKYGNRFKIVTLDGQVINAGGSMTGGSRVQNAGILSRSGAIDDQKKELESLKKKLAISEQDFKQVSEELALAKAELEASDADLITANEEKVRIESSLTLVRGQLKSVMDALKELEDEHKSSSLRIQEFERIATAAEKEEKTLIQQSEVIEAEISNLTGSAEELLKTREEMTAKSNQIDMEILALTKDIQIQKDTVDRLTAATLSEADREAELRSEIEAFQKLNEEAEAQIEKLKLDAEDLRTSAIKAEERIEALTNRRNEEEAESTKLRLLERNKTTEREQLSGELARLEERKANMLREYDETVNKLYDEYQLTRREAGEISEPAEDPKQTQISLSEVKNKIKALGSVNVGAIEEYKEVSERYEFMSEQISDIEHSKAELTKLIEELTTNMAEQFRDKFSRINRAFGETFAELFGGGKAELLLEDERDILESPIEIKVQPPGKNVQNIDLLSGGEKGLSAIALLFAILKITPAPFCIFDEVEAALDDVNVTRYAQYVRRMTNNTQFILITHRRGTMEESDILYGVTMQEEGVSKLLELKTAEMAKKLGLN